MVRHDEASIAYLFQHEGCRVCGIVGIFNFQRDAAVSVDVLRAMRDSMVHRGPNGAGEWLAEDRRIALGHRRLSIVDLSPAASQPMCNEDRTIWITFNGEIYNHTDLRRELLSAGHVFKTDHSDTEAVVHGYEEWGLEGVAARLKGDYAMALWDSRTRRLHLLRDRIGVKPVYFAIRNGVFAFASEIKALLKHPGIEPDVEPVAMYHFLSFLTTPAPLTMFRGIYKLPPAHSLSIGQSGSPRIVRYWDATPPGSVEHDQLTPLTDVAREKFYVSGVRQRLETAVERRMMSDVPFGVFLSGGIDSSTNVALMAAHMNRPVETFTVGFSDFTHLNEIDVARRVAAHFRTNHHEVLVSEKDMIEYLDRLIVSQDEPIADWVCIPLYFVSKLARDSGTTVVQVGEGSDEQFCGYGSYMMYLHMFEKYWQPYVRWMPSAARKGIASVARRVAEIRPSLAAYADVLDRAAFNREPFWTGAHVFWDVLKRRLIGQRAFAATPELHQAVDAGIVDPTYLYQDSFNVVRSFYKPFDHQYPEADQLTRMIYSEFRLRLPELLLMRVDKICMSESIEARVPFLDHDLVEFTMGIPQRFKIRPGQPKFLLKQAVTGIIPDEIIHRRKMGFGAPMAEWLRGPFGERVSRTLANSTLMRSGYFNSDFVQKLCAHHLSGKSDHSLYIWALFNLVAWFDYWVDGRRAC